MSNCPLIASMDKSLRQLLYVPTVLAFFHFCCSKTVLNGKKCNPKTDTIWLAVDYDSTQYVYCNSSNRQFIIQSCPKIGETVQYFDYERQKCGSLKKRQKRSQKSTLGNSCGSHLDCMDNMQCPFGTCVCNSGFVPITSESICVQALNPGQLGCFHDIQCSSSWPGAVCKQETCSCPDGLTDVRTQDGSVCVKQLGMNNALCPLPEDYMGVSFLDVLAVPNNSMKRLTCIYGSASTHNCRTAGENPRQISQDDIYDCIPHTPGSNEGVCCPSRSMICTMPKAAQTVPADPRGNTNRYWFNSITGVCEPFLWNVFGTFGNGNNFRTLDHCINYCGGTCRRGRPVLFMRTKFTDPITAVKSCSAEADCPILSNMKYSCEIHGGVSSCCPTKESICGRLGGRNYAFAEGHQIPFPDHGSAGIKAMRFYWTGYKCEPFQYNGRAGNWNNFLTKDDCIAYCDYNKVTKTVLPTCPHGEPEKNIHGNLKSCSFGTCSSNYECVSNGSLFACCLKKDFICNQKPDYGRACRSHSSGKRWYFEQRFRFCQTFNYGGCDGNINNFRTETECLNICINSTITDIHLPNTTVPTTTWAVPINVAQSPITIAPIVLTTMINLIQEVKPSQQPQQTQQALLKHRNIQCPFRNQMPYYGSNSQIPLVCDPRYNQCPIGYSCLNGGSGFICCQPIVASTAEQCPSGMVVSSQSITCRSTPCPFNYQCHYSVTFRNFYCCSSKAISQPRKDCPGTAQPYYPSGSSSPARCTVRSIGSCPETTECLYSTRYATTICCQK